LKLARQPIRTSCGFDCY